MKQGEYCSSIFRINIQDLALTHSQQPASNGFEGYVHICDGGGELSAPGRRTKKSGALQLRRTKDGDADIG